MGFQPKMRVKELRDASAISIADITGVYHPTENPTGWQAPNPSISLITEATVLVTKPDPYSLSPAGVPVVIDVYPTLPNLIGNEAEIGAVDLGYTDGKMLDGVYDITLKYITSSGSQYSCRQIVTLFARAECCFQALIAETPTGDICKGIQRSRDAEDATIYYNAMKLAAGCFKVNKFIELLKQLKEVCSRNPCKNC